MGKTKTEFTINLVQAHQRLHIKKQKADPFPQAIQSAMHEAFRKTIPQRPFLKRTPKAKPKPTIKQECLPPRKNNNIQTVPFWMPK